MFRATRDGNVLSERWFRLEASHWTDMCPIGVTMGSIPYGMSRGGFRRMQDLGERLGAPTPVRIAMEALELFCDGVEDDRQDCWFVIHDLKTHETVTWRLLLHVRQNRVVS